MHISGQCFLWHIFQFSFLTDVCHSSYFSVMRVSVKFSHLWMFQFIFLTGTCFISAAFPLINYSVLHFLCCVCISSVFSLIHVHFSILTCVFHHLFSLWYMFQFRMYVSVQHSHWCMFRCSLLSNICVSLLFGLQMFHLSFLVNVSARFGCMFHFSVLSINVSDQFSRTKSANWTRWKNVYNCCFVPHKNTSDKSSVMYMPQMRKVTPD